MPLVDTRALVLQGFAYGDTSKILRLLTPELGVRSVIAKGALRPRSRYGGVLEPFTEGDAHFYLKEGRDLHTLAGFDLRRSRQALGRDLGAFAGASLVAELVLRSGTEEGHPELYDAVTGVLDRLARVEPERTGAAALAGVWLVVALLGYRPEMEACVHCGRRFEPEEPSRFDVEAGGTACLRCRPSGRVVDAATREAIARMTEGQLPELAPEHGSVQRALLRVFLSAHIAREHPLRSLDLFLEQLP